MPKSPPRSNGGISRLKPGGAVTMEMVGRVAGVSQVTVSRALNDPGKVSPPTLKRIRDAIELTGYVPNLVAGALASSRSRLIAALVPSITNIVYASMMQRFIEAIREFGYQVLLSETGFSQEEEQSLVAALLSRRPDGVLLTGIHHSAGCRRMLMGAGVPVVELWDVTETPIDTCIGFSHTEAGEAVARFAWGRGYRWAAAVSADDERALRRKDAFGRAFSVLAGGGASEACFEGPASIARGREALTRLIEDGFVAGVVFCSSDLLAHGVLIEAQARGLGIPGDIAIIGFGDQSFAPHTFPALTTVRVDRSRMGTQAAQVMLDRINGKEPSQRAINIGFDIVERETA